MLCLNHPSVPPHRGEHFNVTWIWIDGSPKTLCSLASFRKNWKLLEELPSQLSSGMADALHQFMWNIVLDTMSVDDITQSTTVRQDVTNIRSDVHDDTTASEMESVQSVSKCREGEEEKHTTPGRRSKMWCWDTVGGKDRKTARISNSSASFSAYMDEHEWLQC